MGKPSLETDNRFSRQTLSLWAVVMTGWLVSLGLFFSQPSLLGMTDAAGQPVGRLADLLQVFLLDQVAAGMMAHGRLDFGLLDRWASLLGLCVWLVTAAWIGWPLVAISHLSLLANRLERVVLAVMIGAAVLSSVTLGIGWAGGLANRWPLLIAILMLVAAAGGFNSWRWQRMRASPEVREPLRKTPVASGLPTSQAGVWLWRLLQVSTVLVAGLTLLGCLMPPWEFDVVEYHLQAPKEFAQSGKIGFVPHNIYANMPLGAEMHSLAAMTLAGAGDDGWWWGGLIGKAITGSFSLLAAALLGSFLSRRLGRWSGWVGAALLLATPGNAHVSMAGLIDMVLAAYVLAATVATTLLWPHLRRGSACFSDGLLIGLLAGAGAACKYPGLLFVVFPIAAVVCVALLRAGSKAYAVRIGAAAASGLAITCVPWYLKNLWWKGNPFFPLASRFFGSGGLTVEQIEQWRRAHRVPVPTVGSVYGLVAMWETAQQVLLRSSFLPPTLVFLTICGVCVAWFKPAGISGKWQRGWLYLMIWIGLVWWLGTHRIDRFWLPALPLVCGLAALGAAWISRRLSHSLATCMVLLSLIYGGFLVASGAIGDNRFLVSLQALRLDAGQGELPGRTTELIGWANRELDQPGLRLLLIGEAKAYDFRMPIVYSTCFDRSPAEAWLAGEAAEQQRQNLARAGITHVIVNWNELSRYRSPGNYGFSAWPQPDDIDRLVANHVLRRADAPFDSREIEVLEVVAPATK